MTAQQPSSMAGERAVDIVALALRFNLHPEQDMHASWWPAHWPGRYRSAQRFGPGGRSLLGRVCAPWTAECGDHGYAFDSPRRRLALIDAPSLRQLAMYCGLCAHKPMFSDPELAMETYRQAARLGHDTTDFVLDRTPRLSFAARHRAPHPRGRRAVGLTIVDRGYRLILAFFKPEGEAFVRRVAYKFPRRVAAQPTLRLRPRQLDELAELLFLCVLPERFSQWDWLF